MGVRAELKAAASIMHSITPRPLATDSACELFMFFVQRISTEIEVLFDCFADGDNNRTLKNRFVQ